MTMTFIEKIIDDKKNYILSNESCLCEYKGKQIRELLGEPKSNKTRSPDIFINYYINGYLPQLKDFHKIKNKLHDDTLLFCGNRHYVMSVKDIKKKLRWFGSVIIFYEKSPKYHYTGVDVTLLTKFGVKKRHYWFFNGVEKTLKTYTPVTALKLEDFDHIQDGIFDKG